MPATWRRIYNGREYVCWKEGGKQHRQLANRWIWEQANGPIPAGHDIHHRDHDPLHNALGNLVCLTKAEHRRHHGRTREDHTVIGGIEHRRCQRCDAYRPLDEFAKRAAGTYQGYCKDCSRDYLREWRAANRERHNAYMRAYRMRAQEWRAAAYGERHNAR
jgi:hypothetical protein